MTTPDPAAPAASSPLDDLMWARSTQDFEPTIGLAQMLVALQLLATDSARQDSVGKKWDDDTPASMQVIKSGATVMTRKLTKWIGGAGGVTAALSGVAAVVSGVATDVGDAVLVALIGGGALVLAATAVAVALFVKGDLEARGVATAARHAGRAEVAAAFLRATAGIPGTGTDGGQAVDTDGAAEQLLAAMAAFPAKVRVETQHNGARRARNVRWSAKRGMLVVLDDDALISPDEITGFTTGP